MTSTILHLGLGAFHRAHQLACLQALHDLGDTSWTCVSGNIRPDGEDPALILRAQGCAYTLETVDPAGQRAYQRITALSDALPYVPGLAALVALGAAPSTRIVSFTVTEAGYHVDADGRLDTGATEVVQAALDARAGRAGTSIWSVLTAILAARRARDAGPLTLLCCDNLRHNGARVRQGLRQFLALVQDTGLAAWMEANTSCPDTMVDRITPRVSAQTGPALRARVHAATGRVDAAAVGSETFLQWVIEDDFRNGRPAWERGGVELVREVAPYEEAKIRILNASHSCIAWAGALAGYRTIHEALRDPRIHGFVRAYVTDAVLACLRPSPIDLEAYRDRVLERFASDAIQDSVERVLADSFAKLPGFVAPTLRDCLARGIPPAPAAVLPALFLQVLLRWQAGKLPVPWHDQSRDPAVVDAICGAADPVAAFCAQPLFWDALAGDAALTAAVRAAGAQAAAMV
jgi:D-arabinitol 4-dehydrogenase